MSTHGVACAFFLTEGQRERKKGTKEERMNGLSTYGGVACDLAALRVLPQKLQLDPGRLPWDEVAPNTCAPKHEILSRLSCDIPQRSRTLVV